MSKHLSVATCAREAVARYEERHGHDKEMPALIRAGACDNFERVQCAKEAVLIARGLA